MPSRCAHSLRLPNSSSRPSGRPRIAPPGTGLGGPSSNRLLRSGLARLRFPEHPNCPVHVVEPTTVVSVWPEPNRPATSDRAPPLADKTSASTGSAARCDLRSQLSRRRSSAQLAAPTTLMSAIDGMTVMRWPTAAPAGEPPSHPMHEPLAACARSPAARAPPWGVIFPRAREPGPVRHIDTRRVVGFQTSVGSTDASKIVRSGGATNDSGSIDMTLPTSASDSWRSRAAPSS
jgi:hypothetical protein